MHVLIHGNLCPLQAQARISRVKCYLWHTDHHATLCIYLYQMKEFFVFFFLILLEQGLPAKFDF